LVRLVVDLLAFLATTLRLVVAGYLAGLVQAVMSITLVVVPKTQMVAVVVARLICLETAAIVLTIITPLPIETVPVGAAATPTMLVLLGYLALEVEVVLGQQHRAWLQQPLACLQQAKV
jgi:hypothetical protein